MLFSFAFALYFLALYVYGISLVPRPSPSSAPCALGVIIKCGGGKTRASRLGMRLYGIKEKKKNPLRASVRVWLRETSSAPAALGTLQPAPSGLIY